MLHMLFSWLTARDAVDVGAALADSFPAHTTRDFIGRFVHRATVDLRSRKLNFYERARFANAFRWKLLEKGVAVETAHEITQTLLVNICAGGNSTTPASAARPAPAAAPAQSRQPVSRRSLDELFQRAGEAAARGALLEAVAQYQEYTAARPKDIAGFNNLGATLTRLGRLGEARKQLHTALALGPRSAHAMFNMGNLRLAMGRFADAENFFRRAAAVQPTDLLIRTHLGDALAHQRLLDKARAEFDKVLKINPRFPPALSSLGTLERSAGRFIEAERLYRSALEVQPGLPAALIGIASSRRMSLADSKWIGLVERVAASTTSPVDAANIRFALGKCFDDLGQYAQAFGNYKQANDLLKALAKPYDAKERSQLVDDLTRVYTPEVIRRAGTGGPSSTRPVFVVGMPRSGTSLVEQILASHPAVHGAGELEFWNDEVRADGARIRNELLPAEQRQRIAADYLEVLRSRDGQASHVVDKTPSNADYLGLIHSVFPSARIIYVRRDPLDTCLSCYFQNFSMALNFKLDLNDLASYYQQHARLMSHWRKVLPAGTILDVPYEELVCNQESWTRRMLDHLGLVWDAACLKFNENARPVVTASNWQVRQRMYGDSVARWRHYSKFIEPLRGLDRD